MKQNARAAAEQFGPDSLSPDQRDVYEAMIEWSHGRSVGVGSNELLTMAGFAGSGKSTLLGVFAAQTDLLVAYVSFTGRAAGVLGRKLAAAGVRTASKLQPPEDLQRRHDAGRTVSDRVKALYDFALRANPNPPPLCSTIHRLLYRPIIDEKTEELRGWVRRTELDRDYDLIVIDEASMVGDELLNDLQLFGVPILAVGDHGQLPPVMGTGSLMANPDLRLEKIHRQAEGSRIIQLSRVIRETGKLDRRLADGKEVIFARRTETPLLQAAFSDARAKRRLLDVGAICWMNKTRVALNCYARQGAGFRGAPGSGEVVICLKNMTRSSGELPIYNGMRGQIDAGSGGGVDGWRIPAYVSFPDEGLDSIPLEMCAAQFNREKTFGSLEELQERLGGPGNIATMRDAGSLFDFGYAMTCHKCIGSQFKSAIFYCDRVPEPQSDDWRRFSYTAITRASERLLVML